MNEQKNVDSKIPIKDTEQFKTVWEPLSNYVWNSLYCNATFIELYRKKLGVLRKKPLQIVNLNCEKKLNNLLIENEKFNKIICLKNGTVNLLLLYESIYLLNILGYPTGRDHKYLIYILSHWAISSTKRYFSYLHKLSTKANGNIKLIKKEVEYFVKELTENEKKEMLYDINKYLIYKTTSEKTLIVKGAYLYLNSLKHQKSTQKNIEKGLKALLLENDNLIEKRKNNYLTTTNKLIYDNNGKQIHILLPSQDEISKRFEEGILFQKELKDRALKINKFMFGLSIEYGKYLEDKVVSPELDKAFLDRGISLYYAKIFQIKKNTWEISDRNETFRIENAGMLLNVYHK